MRLAPCALLHVPYRGPLCVDLCEKKSRLASSQPAQPIQLNEACLCFSPVCGCALVGVAWGVCITSVRLAEGNAARWMRWWFVGGCMKGGVSPDCQLAFVEGSDSHGHLDVVW
jgi:hypothetical protein